MLATGNLHQNQLRSMWQTARKNAPEGLLTQNEVEEFSHSMLHNVETAERYYVKVAKRTRATTGLNAFHKLKDHYETKRKRTIEELECEVTASHDGTTDNSEDISDNDDTGGTEDF